MRIFLLISITNQPNAFIMLKKALLGIIIICIMLLLYYAWKIDYVYIQNVQLILLLSILLYHFLIDKKKRSVFIAVFMCFILNGFFLITFNYTNQTNHNYLLIGNLIGLIGFVIVLWHIIKSKKIRLSISKYSLLIVFTLIIDGFIIYSYLNMMAANNIYISHTQLSVFFPIIKLILISIIIFYYLSNKNLKASLILISMLCFLLSEIAQICQFLFFINGNLQALVILDVGLYVFAIYLLHQYFTNVENEHAKLY